MKDTNLEKVERIKIKLSQEMLRALKAGDSILIESPDKPLEVLLKVEVRHSER